jgi:hypothetical protein
MTSRITALDRPHRFVDEQVRGPFRTFRHEHVFRTEGAETVMIDTLTIGSPVFGALAERVVLVPYLRRLIRHAMHTSSRPSRRGPRRRSAEPRPPAGLTEREAARGSRPRVRSSPGGRRARRAAFP